MSVFQVQLPIFEGPLDLLLYLIERDEIDIYDIPISKITGDFLSYLRYLEEERIAIGSEFIAMAAELMSIKARMLLPRSRSQKGKEEDPRQSLAERLIAYKQMKVAAEHLRMLAEKRAFFLPRGYALAEQQHIQKQSYYDASLYQLTLHNLLRVYLLLQKKRRMKSVPLVTAIKPFPYTIQETEAVLREKLKIRSRWYFKELVRIEPRIAFVVVCFLVILEMIQRGELKVIIGEGPNEFWIESKEEVNL
jgi:segregation and condensation protein A